MSAIPAEFRAYVAEKSGDGGVRRGVRSFAATDLPPGGVQVRVGWSSVNYKDALATIADGKVARISPLIPGIDLAGEVVASDDPGLPVGTQILAHGYDLGVARHGGYGAFTQLPAEYVVPLPAGLDAGSGVTEVGLDELDGALDAILAGAARGRWVVRVGD